MTQRLSLRARLILGVVAPGRRRARHRRRRHLHLAPQLPHLAHRRLARHGAHLRRERAPRAGRSRRQPAAAVVVGARPGHRTAQGQSARAVRPGPARERDDRRDRGRTAVSRHEEVAASATTEDDRDHVASRRRPGQRTSRLTPTTGDGRYRVRASIDPGQQRLHPDRRHVAEQRRQHAAPARLRRAARDPGRARRGRGARALGDPGRPAAAHRDRRDRRDDRRRRSLAARRPRRRSHGGRAARPGAQRDARPDRVGLQRTGGVRAEAPPLRRGRLARAAHAARRGTRLRGAVLARGRPAAGRPRTVDGRDHAGSPSA